MIQLIQVPWSPYCLVQRRILEFGNIAHERINIPPSDRSLIWRLTKERYYQVPILKDGRQVLFETDGDTQVLAKYLDAKFGLGLFTPFEDGVQKILWPHIENEVEGFTFRLNDIHFREFVSRDEQCAYLRHKERKFGPGCIEAWRRDQRVLLQDLARRLLPYELMVRDRPFLLGSQPHFVDFDLWGMLANFLYSGHYALPASHLRLKGWYHRMTHLSVTDLSETRASKTRRGRTTLGKRLAPR